MCTSTKEIVTAHVCFTFGYIFISSYFYGLLFSDGGGD